MCRGIIHHALDLATIGDVERPGLCRTAARRDLLRDGERTLFVIVGDGNVGRFRGEYARGGAPHAAGGTGDENGQALDGPAELLELGHAVSLGARLFLL